MMSLDNLLREVRSCTLCKEHLPYEPRPVLRAKESARILIVGQAPGTKVHASGIPWDDASGERLRAWMGVDSNTFYDESRIAIIPMGFCYPGKGRSGDLPPRRECAPQWHEPLLAHLKELRLILLIGQYAHAYYLGKRRRANLTETVQAFADYGPLYLPLVHPSPRNQLWLKKNPFFERMLVPHLRNRVHELL
ncbi:Uracil-DNA glycosylase superfamily [Leptonema illini DSM 21528]|uniref:Uracil-DNA glycosylase superfamily n=2 Tax=Leptonema illini TaxID=183 RepID=H2CAV4_9LEPT|nr:uracil-DNA glycosylase family protein [Leptonema illini]EHQ08482.1 Uracil-DNA glycosylase superfamily [Leptonema illini DSM 21528]